MNGMPALHLIHGLPGAGKTTFAQELARKLPAVRFTPDEWMIALHGPNPPEAQFRTQHAKIMELIWEHAARALQAGTHVILDVGFWTRASRDDARRRATALGVPCRFYSMACAEETARTRVRQRTGEHAPGALFINQAAFDLFAAQFEPMGQDEAHTEIRESAPLTS